MEKTIRGKLSTRQVFIDEVLLSPARSQKVYNHSPDGFNWGYGGSGPAQLALALLLEFTDEPKAQRLHQKFKWEVIASLEGDWSMSSDDVRSWLLKEVKDSGGARFFTKNQLKDENDR